METKDYYVYFSKCKSKLNMAHFIRNAGVSQCRTSQFLKGDLSKLKTSECEKLYRVIKKELIDLI